MKKLLALATAAFCVLSLGARATNTKYQRRVYVCGYDSMGRRI